MTAQLARGEPTDTQVGPEGDVENLSVTAQCNAARAGAQMAAQISS